jgi:hypothetical protein
MRCGKGILLKVIEISLGWERGWDKLGTKIGLEQDHFYKITFSYSHC